MTNSGNSFPTSDCFTRETDFSLTTLPSKLLASNIDLIDDFNFFFSISDSSNKELSGLTSILLATVVVVVLVAVTAVVPIVLETGPAKDVVILPEVEDAKSETVDFISPIFDDNPSNTLSANFNNFFS